MHASAAPEFGVLKIPKLPLKQQQTRGKESDVPPYAMVTGVFGEQLDGFQGPIDGSILSQEFYETDESRDFVRGYTFQIARSAGPVNTALGGLGGHGPISWGDSHNMRHR